jgi:hypothetical protein
MNSAKFTPFKQSITLLAILPLSHPVLIIPLGSEEAETYQTAKTRIWLERSVDVDRLSSVGGGSAAQE